MNIDHIKNHSPSITMDQICMLIALSPQKLSERYDLYLYGQGKQRVSTLSKVTRYRDGYLKPSTKYENGPPTEFKEFVSTL